MHVSAIHPVIVPTTELRKNTDISRLTIKTARMYADIFFWGELKKLMA